jgi:hypothetical protein
MPACHCAVYRSSTVDSFKDYAFVEPFRELKTNLGAVEMGMA